MYSGKSWIHSHQLDYFSLLDSQAFYHKPSDQVLKMIITSIQSGLSERLTASVFLDTFS